MAYWGPDPASEEALHKSRVLNVEEKAFRRLTKRLITDPSPLYLLSAKDRVPSTPLPEPTNHNGGQEEPPAPSDTRSPEDKAAADRHQFREEMILDFTAFENSLIRIQFLLQSNVRERERYAAEKVRIEETAQSVRESTASLRLQLDDAQKTLAVRKTYDELAEVITRNKALKPRDEQHIELEKLRAEIEDLERESREHDQAWRERREQFTKVADEGARLRRLVRDEKEEVIQPEGDDHLLLDAKGLRAGLSNIGTPRSEEGGVSPVPFIQGGSGVGTPRSRRGTPAPEERGVAAVNEKALTAIPEVQGMEDAEMADEAEVGDAAGGTADHTLSKQQQQQQQQPPSQTEMVKPETQTEQMDTS